VAAPTGEGGNSKLSEKRKSFLGRHELRSFLKQLGEDGLKFRTVNGPCYRLWVTLDKGMCVRTYVHICVTQAHTYIYLLSFPYVQWSTQFILSFLSFTERVVKTSEMTPANLPEN